MEDMSYHLAPSLYLRLSSKPDVNDTVCYPIVNPAIFNVDN